MEDWILASGFIFGMVTCVTVVIAAVYYRWFKTNNM